MNCSNQLSGNDQRVVCKKAYHKKYYAKNRERIPAQQKRYRAENVKIFKTRRKRWYETNKEPLASSLYIVNRTTSRSETTEHNNVKVTGNGSMNIGEVIMPRIRNGSSKDFVTKSKEK